MNYRKCNIFVTVEAGRIKEYQLDSKVKWEIGRPSKDNNPDIRLLSGTISRKHGNLHNYNGCWIYTDYNGKNGTIYNHKRIKLGLGGRKTPILLENGDTFVFGSGEEEVIDYKTVWGMFFDRQFNSGWSTIDSQGLTVVDFICGDEKVSFNKPEKGTVIKMERGIGIYMGHLTYIAGDMQMTGC